MDINDLTINQKIAQLVMPRVDFKDPGSLSLAKKLVKDYQVGGFIIFGGTSGIVRKALNELSEISETPLFFALDAERGVGQVVSDMTLYPFTMSLGAIDDPELVYEQAALIASEMKYCGLNIVFGPVADVNTNPKNPIINIRSYGDDPILVSRLSGAFIKGLQDNGIMACAKHFPGHGVTGVDSHLEMPVSDQTEDDLYRCELIPFENAVDSGVTFIMPAHISYPEISGDSIPATVSHGVITGLLRERLNFGGLIVSDSFRMDGLGKAGDETDMSALSLASGCDIILDPKDPEELLNRLTQMAESDELDTDSVSKSVSRVARIKNTWLKEENSGALQNRGKAEVLVNKIAERSTCVLKGGALKSEKALVFIFDVTQSGRPELFSEFIKSLSDQDLKTKLYYISDSDSESIAKLSEGKDAAICLILSSVGAYKRPPVLPENFKNILHNIESLSREKVLVSLGSPYLVSEFTGYDTVITLFDTLEQCQRAAAQALTGKSKPTGKLPVEL